MLAILFATLVGEGVLLVSLKGFSLPTLLFKVVTLLILVVFVPRNTPLLVIIVCRLARRVLFAPTRDAAARTIF